MASLVSTLDTPTAGKAIINPNPMPGGSALAGLANFGAEAVNAYGNYDSQKRSEAAAQRAEAEAAFKKDERGASNELNFGLMHLNTNGVDPEVNFGGAPAQSVLPDSIVGQADNINMAQRAAAQGRGSQAAVDLAIENLVGQIGHKHPDQWTTIAEGLKDRGITHPVLRDILQTQTMTEDNFKREEKIKQDYTDVATQNGMAVPGDPQQTILNGAKIAQSKYLADQAKQQLALDQQTTDTQSSAYSFRKTQANDDFVRSAQIEADAKISHGVSTFMTAANEVIATGDEGKIAKLAELVPQGTNMLNALEMSQTAGMRANGASDQAVASLHSYYEMQRSSLKETLGNYSAQRAQTLQNMKTTMELDFDKLNPMYAEYARGLGPNTVAAMFNGNLLPKETVDAIRSEAKNFHPGTPEGAMTMFNIRQLLQGTKGLHQFTPEEARKAIPGLVAGKIGNEKAIIQGDTSPTTVKVFTNSYGQLLNAATALTPGAPDASTAIAATNLLATQDSRTALAKIASDPLTAESGLELTKASRAGAQHLLQVLQTSGKNEITVAGPPDLTGITLPHKENNLSGVTLPPVKQSIVYKGGVFRVVSSDPHISPISSLKEKADAENANLNHLVATSGSDENIPKGTKAAELRDHYVNGTPIKGATDKGAVKDQSFDKTVNTIAKDFTDVTTEALATHPAVMHQAAVNKNEAQFAPIAAAAANKYGVPSAFFHELIGQESSWDPTADANIHYPNSHAWSLGQIQPGTGKMYGIDDIRSATPETNLDVAAHYLSDLAAKHGGDWMAAAKEYSGNSYKKGVLDALQRTLGGNSGSGGT